MNTTTFYLEDDNNQEAGFNHETRTFTLQMIQIQTIKWAFKKLKPIVTVMEEDIDLLQKNPKGSKALIGDCSVCNRKNSITVSDNTIPAEGLSDFFKNLGKKHLMCQTTWLKMFWKILEELWKLEQTLVVHFNHKLRKRFHHHYLKL